MTESMRLPADLSICNVATLHAEWMARWSGAEASPGEARVVMDAGAVDLVDAAGIQLLLSLRRFLLSRGAALHLEQPSACLVAACSSLGVSALLATECAQVVS